MSVEFCSELCSIVYAAHVRYVLCHVLVKTRAGAVYRNTEQYSYTRGQSPRVYEYCSRGFPDKPDSIRVVTNLYHGEIQDFFVRSSAWLAQDALLFGRALHLEYLAVGGN